MDAITKEELVGALQLIKQQEDKISQCESTITDLNSQIDKLNISYKTEIEKNQNVIIDLQNQIKELQPAHDLLNDPEIVKGFTDIQSKPVESVQTNLTTTTIPKVKTSISILPPVEEPTSWWQDFKAECSVLWQEITAAWKKFRQPKT